MAAKRIIRNAWLRERSVHPVIAEPAHVTQQEFVKEVNINTIIGKMKKGISVPSWLTNRTPRYEDMTGLPASFQEAFEITQRAKDAFDSLPLEFRREIDHDPRNLDKAPKELWAKFGLLKSPQAESRSEADGPAVPPASSAPQGKPGAKKGASSAPPAADSED